jgi:hypothetical protein
MAASSTLQSAVVEKWSSDHLNNLQQRTKWRSQQPELQPGMLVLLREDNPPPMSWRQAIISENFPGSDGHVRVGSRGQLKCDGTRAETRFHLSAKLTSPFTLAGTSVQLTTGSRGVRISGRNAGYTMFRGNVKGTGYPLHSPVSPSLPRPCVTACSHISTGI